MDDTGDTIQTRNLLEKRGRIVAGLFCPLYFFRLHVSYARMARLRILHVRQYSREQRAGSARGIPPVPNIFGVISSVIVVPVLLGHHHAIMDGRDVSVPIEARPRTTG
jgi:hypothetical protein